MKKSNDFAIAYRVGGKTGIALVRSFSTSIVSSAVTVKTIGSQIASPVRGLGTVKFNAEIYLTTEEYKFFLEASILSAPFQFVVYEINEGGMEDIANFIGIVDNIEMGVEVGNYLLCKLEIIVDSVNIKTY